MVDGEQTCDAVGVSGQQQRPVVLLFVAQGRKQGLDDVLARVPRVVRVVEVVGLVDEQHPALRLLDGLQCELLLAGVVLPRQQAALLVDDVSRAQQPQLFEHCPVKPCHRRLARSGIAHERGMQGEWRHGQTVLPPLDGHANHIPIGGHLLLYLRQPDQGLQNLERLFGRQGITRTLGLVIAMDVPLPDMERDGRDHSVTVFYLNHVIALRPAEILVLVERAEQKQFH